MTVTGTLTSTLHPTSSGKQSAQGTIAYAFVIGNGTAIFLMDADGSNKRMIPGANRTSEPRWSPDGKRLLYISLRKVVPEVFVMNADGTDATLVVDQSHQPSVASWSPDGGRIVFLGEPDAQDEGIYVANVDGSNIHLIYPIPGGQVVLRSSISWSSDGKHIVFVYGPINTPHQLWVVDADGKEAKNLGDGIPGSFENPEWSPNGKKLAFFDTQNKELVVADYDGTQNALGNVTRIELNGEMEGLSWSPDGKRLAVSIGKYGISLIYTLNPDGSDFNQLTDSGLSYELSWKP
jgi:TolB protein